MKKLVLLFCLSFFLLGAYHHPRRPKEVLEPSNLVPTIPDSIPIVISKSSITKKLAEDTFSGILYLEYREGDIRAYFVKEVLIRGKFIAPTGKQWLAYEQWTEKDGKIYIQILCLVDEGKGKPTLGYRRMLIEDDVGIIIYMNDIYLSEKELETMTPLYQKFIEWMIKNIRKGKEA